jgi:hypothetical protein
VFIDHVRPVLRSTRACKLLEDIVLYSLHKIIHQSCGRGSQVSALQHLNLVRDPLSLSDLHYYLSSLLARLLLDDAHLPGTMIQIAGNGRLITGEGTSLPVKTLYHACSKPSEYPVGRPSSCWPAYRLPRTVRR